MAHDAPRWSYWVLLPIRNPTLTPLAKFLETTYRLVVTDRRLWVIAKRKSGFAGVYPIGDVRVTSFRLGTSGSLTLDLGADRSLSLVVKRSARRDAEQVVEALGGFVERDSKPIV